MDKKELTEILVRIPAEKEIIIALYRWVELNIPYTILQNVEGINIRPKGSFVYVTFETIISKTEAEELSSKLATYVDKMIITE